MILFDDFYGQIKLGVMLRLLDHYICRLPVKGAFSYANWTTVYITSNVHPDDLYPDAPERARQAFRRRITSIRRFTEADRVESSQPDSAEGEI